MNRLHRHAALLLAALLPLTAQAHTGHDAHASLMQGLMHPLTGWDHLTLLLCLGFLAAGRGTRLALLCGSTLVLALTGGAGLGVLFPSAPFVEPAIIATVLASLGLLAFRRHIGRAALLSLCMGFALVHGIAHGQEAPAGDLAGYFAGFCAAGAAVYAAGLLAAEAWQRRPRRGAA